MDYLQGQLCVLQKDWWWCGNTIRWVHGLRMPPSRDDYLSVNDTAKRLNVSATTVRNWAAEGRLPEHRTAGGHRRFLAGDVERLLREMRPQVRPKVLVIDDDPAIRYVVKEAFGSVGFDVVEASSGLMGLDAFDAEPPSLVLLDIMMPSLDGFQVMRHLERFGVDVPVLAFSALGERVADRARELGADDFLVKPFDVRDLILRSRRLIDRAERAAS
jgi:excisionase family DNA binding protein